MATTIGAGIGGSAIISPQNAWGGIPNFAGARTLGTMKSAKATWNQHPIQGGTYLRSGQQFNIGSAREILYQSAMITFAGDVPDTGYSLLLACALGSSATMTQVGTTTAYALGGISGTNAGLPDANNTFIDCQLELPTTDATQNPQTYHSGVLTKSEWVFARDQLVSYSHDTYFQQVEFVTTRTAPSEPAAPTPFAMASMNTAFKMGAFGSETSMVGAKQVTFTLERKMATDRIYLGDTNVEMPITEDVTDLTVAVEWDNTTAAATAISALQLAGTPTSIVCKSAGNAIGSGGYVNTFQLNATNCFLDTGGEQSLDGPGIVTNTSTFKGTIDAANDPAFKALLISADTTF